MKKIMVKITLVLLVFSTPSMAAVFKRGTQYQVCFTPHQNCTAQIVSLINHAHKSIYVQAYTFTSHPIAKALVRAKRRGVAVKIIFDKSNFNSDFYSSSHYLIRHGIPAWEDDTLNIAHNKVIIVDGVIVETGSFNYTYSAQKHNAENVLIIHSQALAQKYISNWRRRQAFSVHKTKTNSN